MWPGGQTDSPTATLMAIALIHEHSDMWQLKVEFITLSYEHHFQQFVITNHFTVCDQKQGPCSKGF